MTTVASPERPMASSSTARPVAPAKLLIGIIAALYLVRDDHGRAFPEPYHVTPR